MSRIAISCLLWIPWFIVSADPVAKPNIVLILADDLGYADLACYGHPYAKTPNIDRLADEGMRFTQFYVSGITCSPSRTGLMTGLFPARFPRIPADFGFGDRETVTDLLKAHGYRTGHFGKWHIGPEDSAIDGTYGIDHVEKIGPDRLSPEGRDSEVFAAAIDFIQESASEGTPFYINIWGHSTHSPVDVSEELENVFGGLEVDRADFSATMQEKFDDCLELGGDLSESMREYLGDVYSIDLNVGRVMSVLEDMGIQNDTIVVFSSDHGPAPIVFKENWGSEVSSNMLGYAGEFRGGKHHQYEGGIRVPFIIRWPGNVPAGRVDSESVVSFIDWMPTICDLVGIDVVPNQYDGENVADILLGEQRTRTTPLFWRTSSHKAVPSMRDGDWKFHKPGGLTSGTEESELFNLAFDPSESQNVAKSYPAVASAMSNAVEEWVAGLPEWYEDDNGIRWKDRSLELDLSNAVLESRVKRQIKNLKKVIRKSKRKGLRAKTKKLKAKLRVLKAKKQAL